MVLEKGHKCTNCGEPDEFSDETLCHSCIEKWRSVLITKETHRFLSKIDALVDLCFLRESQLSRKIKGHDYHNGYSCALHDIRGELGAIKSSLKGIKRSRGDE